VSRPTRLDPGELEARLASVPGWARQGDAIRRVFEHPSFADAIAFVNRVAALAEELDHHPDILVEYRRVTLTLTTHDAGGLTGLDLELAARIDRA
jgi:4a-hydroxytetrahydrobiopterin dehydratase